MRFKSPKLSWLSLAALLLIVDARAMTVTATAPYVTNSTAGGEFNVYYPDSQAPNVGIPFYIAPDFSAFKIDFTSTTAQLGFNIAGADTAKNLWIIVESSGTPSAVSLMATSCNGGGCTSTNYTSLAAGALTLTLQLQDICALGTTVPGCTAGKTIYNTLAGTIIPGVKLNFVQSAAIVFSGVSTAEITAGTKITVVPEVSGPDLTACPPSPGFFPGDGSILVDTNGVTAVADPANGSSPVFTKIWVRANAGTLTTGTYDSASISQAVAVGSGEQEITGFQNSVNGTLVPYGLDYGIQDSAGLILFCGDDSTTRSTLYPIANAFATDIQGFLRESNCFVATASYRDGRAPGVMLLRNFRDGVLSQFNLGRDFIGWYYANGPIAADWLIEHPIFRSVSLLFLMPLQALAWITLHPVILFVPLFALILLLGFLTRSTTLLGMIFLAAVSTSSPKALASDQPYIDSLISELPKDPNAPTPSNPDPYVQSVKRKIGAGEDASGYTDEMKKQIGPRDGSEGYTDRIQRTLPKSTGSAIEDYRAGKKLHPNKGDLNTRSAFGFNIMANATRTYTAGANGDVAYDTVYGNGWVPDFTVHYEWRPFTGDFIKKFGLYGSAGASFTKANGVLNYQDTRFGSQSRTEFKFIVLPVNAGLIYRFSLAGFLWPYFAGGPSAIGFIENRNDKQQSHHGYDLGYWFMGGVAFGLDWISPKASWDQYESIGVKHSYFTIDYSYLQSLGGGLVDFTVDGVQVGFTFEI